jgi:hypothetical protein
VFTSLALFNVLIAPLNAFPWVVNGVVEALVSLKRIQTYLLLPQRSPAWAYTPTLLPSIIAAQQQQQQLAVTAGSSGGKEGGGCCGRQKRPGKHEQQLSFQQQQQQEQQQLVHCVWVSASGARGAARASSHDLDSAAAVQFCDAGFAWRKVRLFHHCNEGGAAIFRRSSSNAFAPAHPTVVINQSGQQ